MPALFSPNDMTAIRMSDLLADRYLSRPEPSLHRLPDDFCRTCRGTGVLRDADYRPGVGTVTVAQDCWACGGSGWGK